MANCNECACFCSWQLNDIDDDYDGDDNCYFSLPTSTKPHAVNIVLSKVCLRWRLIGAKGVEEGDRISL